MNDFGVGMYCGVIAGMVITMLLVSTIRGER